MDYAVLDAQWTPHPERWGDLLAVATSNELLEFYRLRITDDNVDLENSGWLCPTDMDDDNPCMVLSVVWHPWLTHVLGVTVSNGDVCLVGLEEGYTWEEEPTYSSGSVHRHDLEAWTLSFLWAGEATDVFSGGDDAALQCSRVKSLDELRTFHWKDRGLHQAGVTAILPLTPDLVVTGSYDDHIRLISCPQGARRQVLAEQNLGGGVWRLKQLSAPASELPQRESVGCVTTQPIIPERFVFPDNPSRILTFVYLFIAFPILLHFDILMTQSDMSSALCSSPAVCMPELAWFDYAGAKMADGISMCWPGSRNTTA